MNVPQPTDAIAYCDQVLDDLADAPEHLRPIEVEQVCRALRWASLRIIELRSTSEEAREAVELQDARHQLGRELLRRR